MANGKIHKARRSYLSRLSCIAHHHGLHYIFLERVPQESFTQFEEETMAWTTPSLVEICIGLEINGYLPAEF
jgi:coenzyme PQQ precursor peptide PqqA